MLECECESEALFLRKLDNPGVIFCFECKRRWSEKRVREYASSLDMTPEEFLNA